MENFVITSLCFVFYIAKRETAKKLKWSYVVNYDIVPQIIHDLEREASRREVIKVERTAYLMYCISWGKFSLDDEDSNRENPENKRRQLDPILCANVNDDWKGMRNGLKVRNCCFYNDMLLDCRARALNLMIFLFSLLFLFQLSTWKWIFVCFFLNLKFRSSVPLKWT